MNFRTELAAMRTLTTIVALTLITSLTACASSMGLRCTGREQHGVLDTLYFGAGTPDGTLSHEDWSQFLQVTVTPRFPQGLTVFAAEGQWLGKQAIPVHLPTYVLQIVHPDTAQNDGLMTEIISAYEARFRQESVLRIKVDTCYSF